MIDWIKSFFGKGYARIRFEANDGQSGVVKFHYVGEWDNRLAKEEFVKAMKERHGIRVVRSEIIGVFLNHLNGIQGIVDTCYVLKTL